MAENSSIEWTDHTFNPWIGCTKVGPGCDNCYAKTLMDDRMHMAEWGPKGERVRTSVKNWNDPVRWNAQHDAFFAEHGRRQRVFCASLADVFDNSVPEGWRLELFNLIRCTPNLDWLLLTKRVGNVRHQIGLALYVAQQQMSRMQSEQGLVNWLGAWADGEPPNNVWLGATIVNQEEANRDIPKLLATPARVRFLSMEPLLGRVNLRHLNLDREYEELDALKPETWEAEVERWRDTAEDWEADFLDWFGRPVADVAGPMHARVDWVIVGGESGPGARPMHPDWARSLRDQCEAAGVPFLFKQWGEWAPTEPFDHAGAQRLHIDGSFDGPFSSKDVFVRKVGKKAAGRLLDGRTHDGSPT